ncbi:MAG: penicillin-binding protein 1C [Planctomycetes bacterium]|nr:penicillin-binding protein 1C [Planctomycetota bacterium]
MTHRQSTHRKRRNRLRRRRWARRAGIGAACLVPLCILAFLALNALFPFRLERLTDWPQTRWVTARSGETILAVTGSDEHWRRPVPLADMSPWLCQAIVAVEDERFAWHPGVDPIAVCRAALDSAKAGRVVSGASTLTMQLCRMASPRSRSVTAKIIESFRAVQLELAWSKPQILETYLNVAPFGGNIRGVAAAADFYWGKRPADLSLGEAALLAGLPQSPEKYRPDRHIEAARRRRNHVLSRMVELGQIDASQEALAKCELVLTRKKLRRTGMRGVAWAALSQRGGGGRTTIDWPLQLEIERLVGEHAAHLAPKTQVAVLAVDIESAEIRAWVGSTGAADPINGQVDGVFAKRSPGSALKPFIYATAFETGRLGPASMVYDVPVDREGWEPNNFDPKFAGRVRADEALRRSLNVPAILIAEQIGLSRCAGLMRGAGIALPQDAAERAGLSLAVGGTEVTLFDLTNGYATIGRGGIRRAPKLFADDPSPPFRAMDASVCSVLDEILSVNSRESRPADLVTRAWFMWKTGTSSGRRDAWAVGHNRRFAVGVWVGRFSGAGHYAYVGKEAAEPLLVRLFQLPGVAQMKAPRPTETWAVERELPPPMEAEAALRITSPASGAKYVAVDSIVKIQARANRESAVFWFLNGEPAGRDGTVSVSARAGRNELLCCDADGQVDRVEFEVVR